MVARRSVVVTGASGALGKAVVEAFAAEGARLSLIARSEGALRGLLTGGAADAVLLPGDVTDGASMQQCMAEVLRLQGGVDVLVHVAGGFAMAPVEAVGAADWQHMMSLNAWSFVAVTQPLLPSMRARGGARVVAVTSQGAGQGRAGMSAYAASKSALSRLVESLSHEERAHGIRVNSVAPSTLDTPANRAAMPHADRSGWVSTQAAARAIHFLASDAAEALRGQHLVLGA